MKAELHTVSGTVYYKSVSWYDYAKDEFLYKKETLSFSAYLKAGDDLYYFHINGETQNCRFLFKKDIFKIEEDV